MGSEHQENTHKHTVDKSPNHTTDSHEHTHQHVTVKKSRKFSPLWILPLVALFLTLWLAYQTYDQTGETVKIQFSSAQGLVEGRTTIRYQGLDVGIVNKIDLSQNLKDIYVTAEIYPHATKLLTATTRFWLIKPEASLNGISGLDALVSGNYIAISPATLMDPAEKQAPKAIYIAEEDEPLDIRQKDNFTVTLTSSELSSVSIGSNILFRKIPIGEVTNFTLKGDIVSDDNQVEIQVSIDPRYAHLVNSNSRFWNVSPFDATVGFDGLKVNLNSLTTLLSGAIAVDSPTDGKPVEELHRFKLYDDLKTAERGIQISIQLPNNSNISVNSPIMFKGIEAGQISKVTLSDDKTHIIASAAIQPIFRDNLNDSSQFVLEEPHVSLTEMNNLSNLIRGNYLTLIPGTYSSDKKRHFTAIRKHQRLHNEDKVTQLKLTANTSYGLSVGTPVLYKGMSVGKVSHVYLTNTPNDHVQFDVQIENRYVNRINSHTRFYLTSNIDANFDGSGLDITVPPITRLLTGSISFDNGSFTNTDYDKKIKTTSTSEQQHKPQLKDEYTLFASLALAELADDNTAGSTQLNLYAPKLPNISKGSPLLYRNMPVGEIENYFIIDGGIQIQANINNKYRHLITKNTVFWNRSGIEMQAGINSLKVTASPLISLIKGGLAFDTIYGVENKQNAKWIVYSDQQEARQFGKRITLTMQKNKQVADGMPIRYQGVDVGIVTSVTPNFQQQSATITARVFPEYVTNIANKGSIFTLITPQIGLGGAKNIDALLVPYIEVAPNLSALSKPTPRYHFQLKQVDAIPNGTTFYVQSIKKGSVSIGTPVLYRDIHVGQVTQVELSDLADRVIITLNIHANYAYLVRTNSVFWDVSGLNVDVGLSGANIKAGTFSSMVDGGIAFATPENNKLQPKAVPNTSFSLHKEAKSEWLTWKMPIPK